MTPQEVGIVEDLRSDLKRLTDDHNRLYAQFDEVTREKNRLIEAAASREHALLQLQDRVNEMEQERIAGVSHRMIARAFVRDDRDLLLQLRERLDNITQTPINSEVHPYLSGRHGLARELLALFPDDLL